MEIHRFLENERGSIKNGKYADFLLVTKDMEISESERLRFGSF